MEWALRAARAGPPQPCVDPLERGDRDRQTGACFSLALVRSRIALVPALITIVATSATTAMAADPIMPLASVSAGMQCTGLSVIRGTAVSGFNVEIVDVLRGDAFATGPRLLIRVSGPAVDATGVGPGFSGSPIYCKDSAGVKRNAGAISESVGEYGNEVALATPIEEILGDRPTPPATARKATALLRRARPIATPLTIAGLSGPMRTAALAGARRASQPLLTAPAGPFLGYAPYPLEPGRAIAAGISSGDIAVGAIGTVTYRDGSGLWAFGHPFDGYGRRSLPLLDAYVYSVIDNPVGAIDEITYKLATPGRPVGTLTNDALSSIVGRVGPLPKTVPVTVFARGLDNGRTSTVRSQVADERRLGLGSGLDLVTTLAAGQAATSVLRSAPLSFTTSMCLRVTVRQARKPLGFCKRYFDGEGPLSDISSAIELVDGFKFGRLDVNRASVRMGIRSTVQESFIVGAHLPRRVRPGQLVRIRLALQRSRAGLAQISFQYRIPRSTRPGRRVLTLRGTTPNSLGGGAENVLEFFLGGFGGGSRSPRSVPELASRIHDLGQADGIHATFSKKRSGPVVYRDARSLIRGKLRIPMRVVRRSAP
jgi:hypothetical protein